MTVGEKKENLVSTPPRSPENAISKARKIFYITNKSPTFASFCYPYVNLLNFASFVHKSQPLFFSEKP